MRKTLIALTAISTFALVGAASAQEVYANYPGYYYPAAPVVAGAATGTVVGLGLANGWFGSGTIVSAFPTSAAGAAVAGGVAGVGTIALIDAATQPCAGFRALFSPFAPGPSGCVNGQFVGYQPHAVRRAVRR